MTNQQGLSRRSFRSELRAMRFIAVKEAKHLFRYPTWILVFLALPYMLTGMSSLMGSFVGGQNAAQNFSSRTGTENYFTYQIIGATLWMLCVLVLDEIGQSLRAEQLRGTMEQNYLAPVNRGYFLIALTFSHLAIAFILFLGIIIPNVVLFSPASIPNLIIAIGVLVLGLIPLYGLGFLYAAIVVRIKEAQAITNFLNIVFAIITGTYYPVYLLPFWVQAVSAVIPITYSNEQLRAILLFNKNLVDMFGSLVILGLLGFAYPTVGYWAYRAVERSAKRGGGLGKY